VEETKCAYLRQSLLYELELSFARAARTQADGESGSGQLKAAETDKCILAARAFEARMRTETGQADGHADQLGTSQTDKRVLALQAFEARMRTETGQADGHADQLGTSQKDKRVLALQAFRNHVGARRARGRRADGIARIAGSGLLVREG
jgi:hypothetical protein